MGLLVGDQIDNKTEASVANSISTVARAIRIACYSIAFGAGCFGLGFLLWGISRL